MILGHEKLDVYRLSIGYVARVYEDERHDFDPDFDSDLEQDAKEPQSNLAGNPRQRA